MTSRLQRKKAKMARDVEREIAAILERAGHITPAAVKVRWGRPVGAAWTHYETSSPRHPAQMSFLCLTLPMDWRTHPAHWLGGRLVLDWEPLEIPEGMDGCWAIWRLNYIDRNGTLMTKPPEIHHEFVVKYGGMFGIGSAPHMAVANVLAGFQRGLGVT